MAMDLGSTQGDSSSEEMSAIASINVTPFVDVVLVLLVIFMVTAPFLSKDTFGITLPKASTGEQKIIKNLGVAVTKEGQILLDGQLTTPEALGTAAASAVQQNPEVQALISADGESMHKDIVRAIDIVRSAGLTHFAFQVEKP